MRRISIEPCLNGYIVGVGCQNAVFNSHETMCLALAEYYKDPAATEKKWLDKSEVNRGGGAGNVGFPEGTLVCGNPTLQMGAQQEVPRPFPSERR